MIFFVDLDDANHGLAVDLRVVIDDNVKVSVDRYDTRAGERLLLWQLSLLEVNVVCGRDGLLLLIALS